MQHAAKETASPHGYAHMAVVVPREAAVGKPLVMHLRHLGAYVLPIAGIGFEDLCAGAKDRAAFCHAATHAQHIAFASMQGVLAMARAIPESWIWPRSISAHAIGPSTAAAWRTHFGAKAEPAMEIGIAAEHTSEGLAEHLQQSLPQASRVLLPGAQKGRGVLPDLLQQAGLVGDFWAVYRTLKGLEVGPFLPWPKEAVAHRKVVVLATSPSAFLGLYARTHVPASALIVSIGPTTSAAVRQSGHRVYQEAQSQSIDGMLAVLATLQSSQDGDEA